jgi:hypothetical protein
MNSVGDCAPSSGGPAHQGLGTDDAVIPGVDLGLVVHAKLAPGQRQAQIGLHAQALAGGLLHGVVIHLRDVAPRILGAVQGNVGAFEQVRRRGAMVGNQRHADARRHLQALAIEEHRF